MDKKNSKICDGIPMTEEVKRLKKKMQTRVIIPPPPTVELPDMEKDEKTTEEKQAEAQKLREKSDNGAVSVVKKVMQQPEVQGILKKNINKQTFISGLFMAFLLIGFLEVSQAIKQALSYNWIFDLVAGLVMIIIGGIYMVKNVLLAKSEK